MPDQLWPYNSIIVSIGSFEIIFRNRSTGPRQVNSSGLFGLSGEQSRWLVLSSGSNVVDRWSRLYLPVNNQVTSIPAGPATTPDLCCCFRARLAGAICEETETRSCL